MAAKTDHIGTKSVFRAYLCWAFGGIFGLHHFYLNNDRQAFICWSTFGEYQLYSMVLFIVRFFPNQCNPISCLSIAGGYVLGWLCDIFRIPAMVRDANEDPATVEAFKELVRTRARPPFSISRVGNSLMVACLWIQLAVLAIPNEDYQPLANWTWLLHVLHAFVPTVCALAIWTVGNAEHGQQGRLKPLLIASYAVFPLRFFVAEQGIYTLVMSIVCSLVFEFYVAQWQLQRRPRRSLKRRVATLYVCGVLYLSMLCSFGYFNGSYVNAAGETVPVHEALGDVFKPEVWMDVKKSLDEAYAQIQHNGWSNTFQQVYEQLDFGAEQRAYSTLGLTPMASQAQITAAFRSLSKENHPDKVKGTDAEKRAAQEKFMAISQAYEKLSKSKSKRRQKSSKSKDEPITL